MTVGTALGSDIPDFCKWTERITSTPTSKVPISQYDLPLCVGSIEIETESGPRTIRIRRAHLEEDIGKLGHELPGGGKADGSLLDLNRAGTSLLEIVSGLTWKAEEAVTFARNSMPCVSSWESPAADAKRAIRFEPNVNVVMTLEDGSEVATPIAEAGDLNSFRHQRPLNTNQSVKWSSGRRTA